VWLSWPLNPATWPGVKDEMEESYAAFASAISRFEELRVICAAAEQHRILELLDAAEARMSKVKLFDFQTDDAWCRDHGPVFLKNADTGETAIADFIYNAWGGKFSPWSHDDEIPVHIAKSLSLRRFEIPFVCEGGALEVNGAGTLLTTESVVLNPNRNPEMSKLEAEQVLKDTLGVEQVLWLKSGMVGDDTDGHIDTLTRFFRKDAVLSILDDDPNSPNYEILRKNFETLKKMRLLDGSPLLVEPLPCPKPMRPKGWREDILPASYANFLVINGAVLVPSYRQDKSDEKALAAIAQAYPGREIIPIDCFDIVLEGGALHCLSQQQPS
jgi:agmatine deiminase